MNHFLALRPDAATRDRLAAICARLQAWGLPARWTHVEDLHLTLAFLGDLAPEDAQGVPFAITELAAGVRRPNLRLSGLGATGSRHGEVPRAVFAAVDDPGHACEGLHRDLCALLDLVAERRFLPHLTLCRPQPLPHQRPETLAFRDWPHLLEANGQAEWGDCRIASLVWCRSHPGRTPKYEILGEWSVV